MTNAHQPWLAQLVAALVASMPRGLSISTSRDLSLSPEAKFVSQAVDMMIAQKAEMMIGNGVSSSSPPSWSRACSGTLSSKLMTRTVFQPYGKHRHAKDAQSKA
uniref:Uncharacterized protein n=1 Tax=Mycena chlorophos TaxID=658473 RepID=A0ABQ0LY58_MYCCL|nr:predicted protein [Mycena chlorophos]